MKILSLFRPQPQAHFLYQNATPTAAEQIVAAFEQDKTNNEETTNNLAEVTGKQAESIKNKAREQRNALSVSIWTGLFTSALGVFNIKDFSMTPAERMQGAIGQTMSKEQVEAIEAAQASDNFVTLQHKADIEEARNVTTTDVSNAVLGQLGIKKIAEQHKWQNEFTMLTFFVQKLTNEDIRKPLGNALAYNKKLIQITEKAGGTADMVTAMDNAETDVPFMNLMAFLSKGIPDAYEDLDQRIPSPYDIMQEGQAAAA
ncbi:hypothetical protein H6771_00500 [Candidatus Peribacteria bacterium]|nr:hypothetical protein [Candidatus Peribacteria bacterium]